VWTEKEHTDIIRWNVLFPTFLTRALLPGLRKTARDYPVLVVFVGSIAGSMDMPRVSIYSASKIFLSRLSGNLREDERFHNGNSNLSFMYLEVGEVNSGTMTAPVNWTTPAADEFAKTVVHSFGSGRRIVTPYLGHAILLKLTSYLPESLTRPFINEQLRFQIKLAEKNA
jgi:17beta-estradiol 17-dehydrogenase / very-long-chain 3-oxoacyl-CoA reductase